MQTYQETQPPRKRSLKWLWLLIIPVVLLLLYQLLAVVIVVYVVQPIRIEGKGMSPTLNAGDKVFLWKQFGELQRGDIVGHLYPLDTTKSYVKRIVGMPGETVEVRDGRVFINDKMLDEPYMQADYRSVDTVEPTVVPANQYYVMGDNRPNSSDSRIWGTVARELVYGKFWYRYANGASSNP
ncbi:MAG: signal peptidase I [Acidobacteria bacterium]|nr:signal peptidase I [Acidobacteriota bacterium]